MTEAIDQLFPMVFCCTKCNTIVSDSTEFLCSRQDLNCIVMAGGTNFRTEITYGTSISPEYVMGIFCSKCDAALGKQYLDSRTHPDLARTGVCLNVSAMDSYQLGTGEVRFCERRPATPGAATPDKATAPESSALHQRIADLENDLVKVQNMVLLHQERLEALEGAR